MEIGKLRVLENLRTLGRDDLGDPTGNAQRFLETIDLMRPKWFRGKPGQAQDGTYSGLLDGDKVGLDGSLSGARMVLNRF